MWSSGRPCRPSNSAGARRLDRAVQPGVPDATRPRHRRRSGLPRSFWRPRVRARRRRHADAADRGAVRARGAARRRALPPAHDGSRAIVEPVPERFRSVSLFTGPALRGAVDGGRAPTSCRSSCPTSPALFTSGRVPLDVALVQLSPPDAHGHCTLGTSVDAARAAVDTAKVVIAEINEQMPRTHGNTVVPLSSRVTRLHPHRPPAATSTPPGEIGEVEAAIGAAGRRPRRRRRVPADGHRRDPRRRARAPGRQARPRRAHRDVLRRPRRRWSRRA